MHEEHKKSHKKEEKKAKMHEKKAMKSKSAERESDKSKEKKSQKKAIKDKEKMSEEDHDDKIMMPNNVDEVAATATKPKSASKQEPEKSEASSDESTEESVQSLRKHQRSSQPMLMSASSSTFRPALTTPPMQNSNSGLISGPSRHQYDNSATLMRLLNANHDEDLARFVRPEERTTNSTGLHNHQLQQLNETTVAKKPETKPTGKPYSDAGVFQRLNLGNQVNSAYIPQFGPSQQQQQQQQLINQLASIRQHHQMPPVQPASVPSGYLTAAQAEIAARLIHLVQSASSRAPSGVIKRIEERQRSVAQQVLQPVTPSQSPQFTMISSPRSQINFNRAVADPPRQSFGADQLLDYQLYPLSKASHSLFT